jgi:hypothetical protein
MARAAGIDTSGMTPGELRAVATWAGLSQRAPILPEAGHV